LLNFFAFPSGFLGGVSVTQGDVTGDGVPEVIVGAGAGGGPLVAVFDLRTGNLVRTFFAYEESFRGGISVAAGDLNGDGLADILAGAGIGGGPVVAVFDPKTGLPTASIFAFDEAFRGGVNVAAVDVNGDGKAEVLAAPGPGLP